VCAGLGLSAPGRTEQLGNKYGERVEHQEQSHSGG